MTNTQELIKTGLQILGDPDTRRNYGSKADVLHGMALAALDMYDMQAFRAIQEMQNAAFRLGLMEITGGALCKHS